jgi:hypothetical protein
MAHMLMSSLDISLSCIVSLGVSWVNWVQLIATLTSMSGILLRFGKICVPVHFAQPRVELT